MVDLGTRPDRPLRVVFLGTPAFSVPTLRQLLASRHPVVGVLTQPDRRRGRGQRVTDAPVKAEALAHGLPVLQPDRLADEGCAEALARWAPDLGVVVAYGQLIPARLLALPRHGMINLHASLLPRYRGAAPVHRAIIDGATETGVTIMRVEEALDAGAIFASATRPIGPDETSDTVQDALAELGAPLVLSVVDAIADGSAVEVPQDDARATYAPRLTKAEGLLDWTRPAREIHNRVRGLHPWPHGFTYLDGRRVIVRRTRVEGEDAQGTSIAPGTILDGPRDRVRVSTGDGLIAITELQLEGGRAMSARDFLASRQPPPGTRFDGPQP